MEDLKKFGDCESAVLCIAEGHDILLYEEQRDVFIVELFLDMMYGEDEAGGFLFPNI